MLDIKEIQDQVDWALGCAMSEYNQVKEITIINPTTDNNDCLKMATSNLSILQNCYEQIQGLVDY